MIAHIAGESHRFRLSVSAITDKGGRASNEDYLGMIDLGSRGFCCTLADGAGGHGNGALAARLTVDAVLGGYRENPMFAPASLASLIFRAEHTVSGEQPTSISRMNDKLMGQIARMTAGRDTPQELAPGQEEVTELEGRFKEAVEILSKTRFGSTESGLFGRFTKRYVYTKRCRRPSPLRASKRSPCSVACISPAVRKRACPLTVCCQRSSGGLLSPPH